MLEIEGKTFMICGGAGFIGTNLTKRLLDLGGKVIAIDNFSSSKTTNVAQFLNNENYKFLYKDICDLTYYEDNVNYIINLACVASPPQYFKRPLETLRSSITGVKNLLELAKSKHCMFLQSSTSEVYGNPDCEDQDETYNGNVSCTGDRACYDEGKRVAETLITLYNKLYNVDTKIIRIFNTYGEYMDQSDGRVISNFIVQALNNEPITVHNDGLQTRSYQYIDDLIDGMLAVLDSDIHDPINIGNPDEHTVLETAKIIKELTHSDSKIIFTQGYPDDPQRRKPNIKKAKELLNWQPTRSLQYGLKRTIDYFQIIIK